MEDGWVASVHELQGLAELKDEPEAEDGRDGEVELSAVVSELAEVAAVVKLQVGHACVSRCGCQLHEDVLGRVQFHDVGYLWKGCF